MALDKNKAGIMAAIQAATEGKAPLKKPQPKQAEPDVAARAHRSLPRGTVGSVRAGLGGIQEIETALILPWGPVDRLELTAVNSDGEEVQDLAESIRNSGQQVPVLLRPAPSQDGKFEVVYGRRRILACQELGVPVNALIRTLDDGAALMAKGLENAARVDLSFYERARFAKAILDQGYSRDEAMQALSISKNSLSQFERIARLVPDAIGVAIGAAPGSGRPKWMALAAALESEKLTSDGCLSVLAKLPVDATSDERLQILLQSLSQRGADDARPVERSPITGAAVKTTKSSVTLTVRRSGRTKEFADWIDANIDRLLKESYETFKKEAGG